MDDTTRAAIALLRADAVSGASELLPRAIVILRGAGADESALVEAAREVCLAQPSMAPLWNAALAAMAGPSALDRFEQRWRRAGAAMARVAVEALSPEGHGPLHVVTWSFSGSALACLRALAGPGRTGLQTRTGGLHVSCAEGRPAFEGRRMASALAADAVAVEFYSDAAVALALQPGPHVERVVLIGADAIAPGWFVNKVGTGMLAAAAARVGVPVYVAATRDKFVDERVAPLLTMGEGGPEEVWDGPPPGVTVRNPCFERVPLDLITGIVTDAGLLTADMIGEACRAASAAFTDAAIARLAFR